ncbi:SIMPL domain-containing protein [Lysinibacillus sphaericus]|uniref:26 kDa periplasmic immunogenic protein n=1 Tax=Lysinibacillus sphaericus OT4b.31 TaxID=1285586 RepID=R7ZB83_LYSSH|nr:SIMPL domain-containing protein [Lysinibacillus sphaericus]EON71256.1 26 kDa periplasmic immunogenic protein [Lysinibacillus sphaericus OT4b.31]
MYYANVNQHSIPASRIITVTGNGKVLARANYAQLQIEVSTQGQSVQETQQENASIMNRVLQSILALNIPRENVQTAAYTIAPLYDFVDGKQVFKGYEVTNAITVKIPDTNQVGSVIDTAVHNGANRISSIQFKIDNADVYYQQALSLALHNAQMKAKTIAETMQLSLHPQPIEIVEEHENGPVLYRSMAMAESTISTPIEQGQMTISATVRVKFQY